MRKALSLVLLLPMLLVLGGVPVAAQEGETVAAQSPDVRIFAQYPSLEVALGDTVNFDLTVQGDTAQSVALSVDGLPEGWKATFRGGGKVIHAVYVDSDENASIDLRLELPEDVQSGTYHFDVVAQGETGEARATLELIIEEKLPPSLSFEVDLPTLRGTRDTTFRYNATLKNDGDEDLSVNLIANAPDGFQVTFKLSGQEVTSVPIPANSSKHLTIEAKAYTDVEAGTYPFEVIAQGEEARASVTLTAEVTGQASLSISGVDGRLSGTAYAGKETTIKLVVRNSGTAPARGIKLSASPPADWDVTFEPEEIAELPADNQIEVTVKIKPSEKAVAGDYIVTLYARPEDGASKSVDFRMTVRTSTLWGLVGVAVIAAAVVVVGLAVSRFGRR